MSFLLTTLVAHPLIASNYGSGEYGRGFYNLGVPFAPSLPNTGSSWLLLIGGAILVIAGIYILIRRRRQRKNQSQIQE